MAGRFKNLELNIIFRKRVLQEIIKFVFTSMDYMNKTCKERDIKIQNHEERIRTHLLENYLDNDEFRNGIGYGDLFLRFEPEIPENYNSKEENYTGRVDIKVIGEDFLKNKKDYYIIECKRIDGSQKLNKAFVEEGICRFVKKNSKYSSYNNVNFMLGFIVKNINITSNANEIDCIQRSEKTIKIEKEFVLEFEEALYCLYNSIYNMREEKIELKHMFYNFSDIIQN